MNRRVGDFGSAVFFGSMSNVAVDNFGSFSNVGALG